MTSKKAKSFQQAYQELEKLTEEFENEDLDLEESLPKFRKALELSQLLKERLSKIENEISEIKEQYKVDEDTFVEEE